MKWTCTVCVARAFLMIEAGLAHQYLHEEEAVCIIAQQDRHEHRHRIGEKVGAVAAPVQPYTHRAKHRQQYP